MKYFVSIMVLVILVSEIGRSQFTSGDIELSMTGGVGFTTRTIVYDRTSSDSVSQKTINNCLTLSLGFGLFIVDGLSFEPEIGLSMYRSTKPIHSMIANLVYTFLTPRTSTAMFFKCGYGTSNAYEFPGENAVANVRSKRLEAGILNIGMGAKTMLSERTVLRVELNYRSQTYVPGSTDGEVPLNTQYSYVNYSLLMGWSVIL
jgi:hypothetical protein